MIKHLEKSHPASVGLLQALFIAIYCFLIGGFFFLMEYFFPQSGSSLMTIGLMLILLVISAAITGMLFFGYSAFLVLNKRIKRALNVVAYTFLFCIIIFVFSLSIMIIIQ